MSDGAPQIWDIPLTPSQRWILVQIALDPSAPRLTDAAQGKAFRRALRAFGMMPIRDALRAHANRVSPELVLDDRPALFKVTAENRDVALGWAKIARHPGMEIDAGVVFDLLEGLAAEWSPPAGITTYDPGAEDWSPGDDEEPAAAEKTVTCPSCKQQIDLGELTPT